MHLVSQLLIVVMTFLASLQPVLAQDSAGSGGTVGDAAETGKSGADAAIEPLKRDFKNLYDSLRANSGIAPADKPFILALQDRAAEFTRQYPEDLRGLAIQLTIARWLKDDQRVETLYDRIISLAPDRLNVRLDWVVKLKLENRFAEAIEVLQRAPIDPAKSPDAILTLSECLFAGQRFQESLDALNSIPSEVQEAQPLIKQKINQSRPIREKALEAWAVEQSVRAQEEQADTLPRVKLVTARGPIVLELFEDHAPNTVANFITLAEQGFYNGTKFHRVEPNFMAQGGDPNSREGSSVKPGNGNPGYYIIDEVGREDYRRHFTGSLAMAKLEAPNTAGSQFYITHQPTPHLDGKHTVFGRVIEGLDIARSLKVDDVLEEVSVQRKRQHEYAPQTLPLPVASPPTTQPTTLPTIPPPSEIQPIEITEPE